MSGPEGEFHPQCDDESEDDSEMIYDECEAGNDSFFGILFEGI